MTKKTIFDEIIENKFLVILTVIFISLIGFIIFFSNIELYQTIDLDVGGDSQSFSSTAKINDSKKGLTSTKNKLLKAFSIKKNVGTYDLDMELEDAPISSLSFRSARLDTIEDIKIKELEKEQIPGQEYAFAIDPSEAEFDSAILRGIAAASELYKCAEWDYEKEECLGSWKKILDTVPGGDYEIRLSPDDPAFVFADLKKKGTVKGNLWIKDSGNEMRDIGSKVYNRVTKRIMKSRQDSDKIIEGFYDYKMSGIEFIEEVSLEKVKVESDNIYLNIETDIDESGTGFLRLFSVDPTSINFERGNITITAVGTELYKCRDWNFTNSVCLGTWELFASDLSPGESYTFGIGPDDPGFGEIIITKSYHLDENYEIISNIFNETRYQDDVWSDKIYENEFVRVTFEEDISNDNIIFVYARGDDSGSSYLEVYAKGTTSPLIGRSVGYNGATDNIISEGWYQVDVENLDVPEDEFDLKIISEGGWVEFDYIEDPAIGDWWDDVWKKRKEINITNAGSTTLTNFPAYLNISKEATMQADFDDLRFINGSCASEETLELDYEIESYTANNADVWIRIPSLPAGGTSICMYYNNSGASNGENVIGVWNANYVMVQHLQETSGTHYDSTSYGNNCTDSGTTQDGTGIVDGGNDWTGAGILSCGTDSSLMPTAAITVEGWFKDSAGATQWDGLVGSPSDTGWDDGFGIWYDAADTVSWYVDQYDRNQVDVASVTVSDYNYYVGTYDKNLGSNHQKLYVNGAVGDTNSGFSSDIVYLSGPLLIGDMGPYQEFVGNADEIRISNIARSSDWINQSYQIVANQDNLVVFGGEEDVPSNQVPTDPTSITCDGGNCNNTFTGDVEINCSGSTDAEGDTITYVIDADYGIYSCSDNGSCGSCGSQSACDNCSGASCSWGAGSSGSDIYYFDSWSDNGDWDDTSPDEAVDNDLGTTSNDNNDGHYFVMGTNNYTGGGSGTITSVEVRSYWRNNDATTNVRDIAPNHKPYFGGSSAAVSDYTQNCGTESGCESLHWGPWWDITDDANAPSTWTWSDIQNLDMRIISNRPNTGRVYMAKTEIRVNYSDPAGCSGTLDCTVNNDQDSCENCSQCSWDISSSWTTIGNHTNGSTFDWNISGLSDQSGVDLRCRAIDLAGSSTYSSNYDPAINLTISGTDTNAPIVSLIAPDNNSYDSNGVVTFKYSVADSSSITNCSLIINGAVQDTDDSITKGVEQQFTYSGLTETTHPWQINCTDSNGYEGESSTRYVQVDLPANYTAGVLIIDETIQDSQSNTVNATIEFIDVRSGETDHSTTSGTLSNISSGTFNIRIIPDSHIINSITFIGVNITGNVSQIVDIDDPSETSLWKEIYAVNPLLIYPYSSINISLTAQSKDLFKCENWSFSTQTCQGRWKHVMDIVPGQNYTYIMSDSNDPGFGEINHTINVLDLEDYLLNYSDSIADNTSGILDVDITMNEGPVDSLIIIDYNSSSASNELNMQTEADDGGWTDTYTIDPSSLDFLEANFTANASGTSLWKCFVWNETDDGCEGDLISLAPITPGQQYTFTLNATDPTIIEQPNGTAGKDTRVKENSATTNYGDNERLHVKGANNGRRQRSFLEFNISNIPANVTITSAKLKLYFYQSNDADELHVVAYRINESWNESEATWNNQPGYDISEVYDNVSLTNVYGWYSWDITKLVKEWHNGTYTNYGVMIMASNELTVNSNKRFRSSDYTDNTSQIPKFTIIFNETENPQVSDLATDEILYGIDYEALIFAAVTDNVAVDKVFANISIPNNGSQLVELSYNSLLSRYEEYFNNTQSLGIYNITIIANDTSGNINDTEITTFMVVQPNITAVKGDNPDPVQVGQSLIYNVTLTAHDVGGVVPLVFSDITILTNDSKFKDSPQMIETSSGTFLIVYNQNINSELHGGNHDIWILRSENKGANWTSIRVTDEWSHDIFPNIFEDTNGDILVVYSHSSSNGSIWLDHDIWIVNSSDDGQTWSEPFAIITNSSMSLLEPVIEKTSTGAYYIFYESDGEIWGHNSTQFNSGWSASTQLTNSTFFDVDMEVHIINDTFYLAWAPQDAGDIWVQDIYFVKTKNPLVFGFLDTNRTAIIDNVFKQYETSITSDAGGNIYVGWAGTTNTSDNYWGYDEHYNRTSNELFIARSDDEGNTWDIRMITDNDIADGYPGIVQTGSEGFYYISSLKANPAFNSMDIAFGQRDLSPQDAVNISVNDTKPLQCVVQSVGQGGSQTGDMVNWLFDVQYAGEVNIVTFNSIINKTTPNGTLINNTANITYYDPRGRFIETITVSETTLVIDTLPPLVTIVSPSPGELFNTSDYVMIKANVTDNGLIDTVFANVTIPNDGYNIVPMSYNALSELYEFNFTNTTRLTRYNFSVFANDTTGNINDSESSYFVVINQRPTDPTSLTCDGGPCNMTFNTSIDLQCSGSTDPENDTITYFIEAYFNDTRIIDYYFLNSTFESGNESFAYVDDLYGSAQPVQAQGFRVQDGNCSSGFCLNVQLNLNTPVASGPFSGAWNRSFNVSYDPELVEISADYMLRLDDWTEQDVDFIQMYYRNLSDNSDIAGPKQAGVAGEDSVDEYKSGTILYLSNLDDGTYNFDIGCYLASTDATNENGECWIDNVRIIGLNSTTAFYMWEVIGNHTAGDSLWYIYDKPGQSGVKLRCRATDNGSTLYSNYHNISGNLTIEDVAPPRVVPLDPAPGTQYNESDIIEISANVTDNTGVDRVLANITLPNSTTVQIELTFAGGNKYNASYLIPNVSGNYNIQFIANDTNGLINDTETTYFKAGDYCLLSGIVNDAYESVVPSEVLVFNSTGSVVENSSASYSFNLDCNQVYTIKVVPDSGAFESLVLHNLTLDTDISDPVDLENSPDLMGKPSYFDDWTEAVAWNPDPNLNYTAITINMSYNGDNLAFYKCDSWNYTQRNCTDDNWTYVEDLPDTAGGYYVKTFGPGDPAGGAGKKPIVESYIKLYNVTDLNSSQRKSAGTLLGTFPNSTYVNFSAGYSYRIEIFLNNTNNGSNAVILDPYHDNIPSELVMDTVGEDSPNVTVVAGIVTINSFNATLAAGTEAGTNLLTWDADPPSRLIEGLGFGELVKLWYVVDYTTKNTSLNNATFYGDVRGTNDDINLNNYFNTLGDITDPVINWVNDTPDPVDPGQSINFTANITDNVAVDKARIYVNSAYRDMTRVGATDIWYYDQLDTSVFYAGTYNYTVYANDTSGNNATPIQSNFTINPVVSIILFNYPVNFSDMNVSQTSNATLNQGWPLIVNNEGNVFVNLTMYGHDLLGQTIPADMIGVGNVRWDTNIAFPTDNQLSNISSFVSSNLDKDDNQSIFFRLTTPLGIRPQYYKGNLTIEAVQS